MSTTKLFEVHIPGQPIGKGRPRAFKKADGSIGAYTPEKTVRWESHAALVMQQARVKAGEQPVAVVIEARFERPKRLQTRKHAERRNVPHTAKPDADNITKAVCDALEKSGAVHNDSQAYRVTVGKFYADAGQAPGVTVQVFGVGSQR